MIVIKELKHNNEILFEATIIEDNQLICTNVINYKSVVREMNEVTYLMLYTPQMQPISEVFGFLNSEKIHQSINTRIKALQALKLLYSYQSIISKELKDFNSTDINGLKIFLKGLSPKGNVIQFELLSYRSNETINGYLSIYRKFLEYLEVENKALFQKDNRKTLISLPDMDTDHSISKFKSNERIPQNVIEVPRYISVKEFQNIITQVRHHYGKREEIIIRLMYQCGCRIGEVLGATADDFVVEKKDNQYITVFNIRNRFSDKKFQLAKTCMKIKDRKEYRSKEYKTAGYGYQQVIIPEDLYELINEYIEEAHSKARETKYDNYYKHTIADRVTTSNEYDDDNYYVFINSQGRPLSQVLWNNTLRKIFTNVGISTDKDVKEHNLNHRFRHGFAMFNIQYLNCREIELKDRMRHNSLLSVSRYFRPTLDDQIQIKTAFAESLYEVIPELKFKE